MRFKSAIIDGHNIAYTESTEFLVQTGKGESKYTTIARYVGNLAGAMIHFQGLNVFNGYKKRLICPSFNKPLIARVITSRHGGTRSKGLTSPRKVEFKNHL